MRFNAPLEGPILSESKSPQYNTGERWDAALKLGNMDTATEMFGFSYVDKLLGNKNPMEYMEKNDPIGKLDPEELNKQFTDMEIPFNKPTSFLIANELNDRAKEKKKLQNIVNNGGENEQGFFSMSTLGQVVAHATDPLEVGADVLIGLSTGGIGNILGKATKFMKTGNTLNKTRAISAALKGNSFTKQAIEGVAANAAIEGAIMNAKEDVNEIYTFNDAFIGTVAGGLAMPVMMFGGSKLIQSVAPTSKLMGQSFKSAFAQFKMGKRIDLSAISDTTKKVMKGTYNGIEPDFRSNWSFKEYEALDFKNDSVYIARPQAVDNLDINNHNTIGAFHGESGVHATTNPNNAHGVASQFNETVGDVVEVNLSKSNLYNLDQPLESLESIQIMQALGDENLIEAFADAKSLDEAMGNVKELVEANGGDVNEISDIMHQVLKDKGYDGVIKTRPGESQDLYIYDPESLAIKNKHKVKPKENPVTSKESLKKYKDDLLNNKERDIFHNKEVSKELDELEDVTESRAREMQQEVVQEYKDLLDEQIENGVADAEDIKLRDSLERSEKLDQAEDNIFKKMVTCLLRNGL